MSGRIIGKDGNICPTATTQGIIGILIVKGNYLFIVATNYINIL